jgi:hypothetical protein
MSTAEVGKSWTISKSVQRSKGINTQGEMMSLTGTLQSMPTSEREVQGLYKVCTGMDV